MCNTAEQLAGLRCMILYLLEISTVSKKVPLEHEMIQQNQSRLLCCFTVQVLPVG
jgi:hypothetical protein